MLNTKRRTQRNNVLVGFGLVLSLSTAMAEQTITAMANFSGKVLPNKCIVNNNVVNTIQLLDLHVNNLATYPIASAFSPAQVSTSATAKNVEINITGCSVNPPLVLIKSKGTVTQAALPNTGDASGVGFGLAQQNNPNVLDNTGLKLNVQADGPGNYKVTGLVVDYVRLNAAPTGGSVKAVADVVVTPQ